MLEPCRCQASMLLLNYITGALLLWILGVLVVVGGGGRSNCPGWLSASLLPASAFGVTRITDLYQYCVAHLNVDSCVQ